MPGWQLSDQTHAKDEQAKDNVVLLESFMVAYQASEVFLRHFYALTDAGSYGSPWFELANLGRQSHTFKHRVAQTSLGLSRAFDAAIDDDLFAGVLGKANEELGADHVRSSRETVAAWVRCLAKHVDEHRDSYNAAKHGLASVPSNLVLNFGLEDEHGVAAQMRSYISGPTLEVLKYSGVPGSDDLEWSHTHEVMDAVVLLRVASVAASLLHQLFAVGRVRHLGGEGAITVQPYPLVRDVTRTRPHMRPGKWSVTVGRSPRRPPAEPD